VQNFGQGNKQFGDENSISEIERLEGKDVWNVSTVRHDGMVKTLTRWAARINCLVNCPKKY
jgi:hypothetical protein